jgi:hypothetical protein
MADKLGVAAPQANSHKVNLTSDAPSDPMYTNIPPCFAVCHQRVHPVVVGPTSAEKKTANLQRRGVERGGGERIQIQLPHGIVKRANGNLPA